MNALRRLALIVCIALLLAGRAVAGQVATDARRVGPASAASAGPPLFPDSVFKGVAEYKFGDNRTSLLAAERLTLGATDEGARKALAAKYAAMLAGPATADGKRFFCRQLGMIGTAAEVPALEKLLADEQFAFAARSALERIPGEEALAVLRRAAEKAKGMAKAGLIQSLGIRRDKTACALLKAALQDPDRVVAAAAVNSLGRIAGKEAFEALSDTGRRPPGGLEPQCVEAMLLISKDLHARGQTFEASMALVGASSYAIDWMTRSAADCGDRAHMHSALLLTSMEVLGDRGGDLLIDDLANPVWRSAAIRALHLDPKESVLKKLADKFASLSPAVQTRVAQALADGRQAAALPIVAQAVASKDSAVHKAGLVALGSVGNATSVPLLVDALQSNDKDLVKQVEEGLARLRGPGVDAALVAALGRSFLPERTNAAGLGEKVHPSSTAQSTIVRPGRTDLLTRRTIIRVLAARSFKSAVPVSLVLAESPDAGVRGEAIRALGALADAKAGLQVIELLDRTPDRAAVETALVSIYRNADTVDPLLQALKQASGPRRPSLVAVLGSLGGPKACEAVRAALKTGDANTRGAALRALAAWPNAAPLDDLLAEVAATQDATIRLLALRGVANLVPMAKDRKPDDRVAVLRKAIALTDNSEQIKPILAALGKIPCRAAAQLAAGYLKDPGLRDEAALAIVEVAEAFGPQAREQVSAELKQARAACDNAIIKARLDAIPPGKK